MELVTEMGVGGDTSVAEPIAGHGVGEVGFSPTSLSQGSSTISLLASPVSLEWGTQGGAGLGMADRVGGFRDRGEVWEPQVLLVLRAGPPALFGDLWLVNGGHRRGPDAGSEGYGFCHRGLSCYPLLALLG